MKKTLFVNEIKEGFEWDNERLVVVENKIRFAADLTTECKSWKTAVKRFGKALNKTNIKAFEGWFESIFESCESGMFTCVENDNFAFYVEFTGDEDLNIYEWYISLVVFKEEETEEVETEETQIQKIQKETVGSDIKYVMFEENGKKYNAMAIMHFEFKDEESYIKIVRLPLKEFENGVDDILYEHQCNLSLESIFNEIPIDITYFDLSKYKEEPEEETEEETEEESEMYDDDSKLFDYLERTH